MKTMKTMKTMKKIKGHESPNTTIMRDAKEIMKKRFEVNLSDQHMKRLVIFALIGVLTSVIGISAAIYASFKPQRIVYIATQNDGKILKLLPLSQPIYNDSMIAQWVTKVLLQTFQYSYFNWQEHFQKMIPLYYTKACMSALLDSFNKNGNLDQLKTQKLLVKSAILQVPVIIRTAIIQDPVRHRSYYQWQLATKMLMTVTNGQKIDSSTYNVFIAVKRTSQLNNRYGLRITQLYVNRVDT